MTLEQIRAKMAELFAQMKEIRARADQESRAPTPDECVEIEGALAGFEGLKTQAQALQSVESAEQYMSAPGGRLSSPDMPGAVHAPTSAAYSPATAPEDGDQHPRARHITGGHPAGAESPGRCGFPRIADFAMAVRQAAAPGGGHTDERLMRTGVEAYSIRPGKSPRMAPTTVTETGVGADGGFAVPPDFRDEIMRLVTGDEALMTRTREWETTSNTVTVPVDPNAPHSSNGIQANWTAEAGQIAQSKVNLEQRQLRLHKLAVLAPVTDEMLEDAPMLESYLTGTDGVGAVITERINDGIIAGDGVGKPLGLLVAPALVTVAKETSQAAATILAANISKMWARMYAPARRTAVWLINQDIEPQLDSMFVPVKNVAGSENVGGIPVYIPANGLAGDGFATLKGRPVIPQQSCETLGTVGDIILADLSRYWSAMKSMGGLRQDVSIHLWFDYDATAFRFIFRVAGQPAWSAALSPKKGSNTLSTHVALATRA